MWCKILFRGPVGLRDRLHAKTIYAVLRHRRLIQASGLEGTPRLIALVAAAMMQGLSRRRAGSGVTYGGLKING
jgi:hypothetical protein